MQDPVPLWTSGGDLQAGRASAQSKELSQLSVPTLLSPSFNQPTQHHVSKAPVATKSILQSSRLRCFKPTLRPDISQHKY
mmetsp:Transcript_10318/g.28171  ORF Transcript_10318/g.28171 Transcript_10318/m.28171 type:complete len:80 (-) Transcript_10318:38-277(-)